MSYGKVHSEFWTDDKIQALPDAAKLAALYLLTCPHRNAIGCARIPAQYIAADLGWDVKAVNKALVELERIGFITRDAATGWTLINNLMKYDPVRGPKAAVGALRLANTVPRHLTVYVELHKRLASVIERELKGLGDGDERVLQAPSQAPRDTPSMPHQEPLRSPEPSPTPSPFPLQSQSPGAGAPPPSLAADVPRGSQGGGALALTQPDSADLLPLAFDRTTEGEIVRRWNQIPGVHQVEKLTKARRTGLQARLRDAGGPAGIAAALAKVAASSFCRGENDRAWRADFDWFVSERGFTRLMEGKFDDRAGRRNGGSVDWDEFDRELDRRMGAA